MNHSDPINNDSQTPTGATEPFVTTEAQELLILPADLFFVEHVDIPVGLESAELDDFAELTLEGLAPFPIEQLNWGFLVDRAEQTMLIYATPRERLRRAGYSDLELYTWVLPDLACLHGARFSADVAVTLSTESGSSYLTYAAGEGLPLQVNQLPPAHTTGATQNSDLKPQLELRLVDATLNEKGRPTFQMETVKSAPLEGGWTPLTPTESTLWRADIRPCAYKTTERNLRRTTAYITLAIRYAALFALLLILFESLLWAGQTWLGTQQAQIDSQLTAVRRLQDKQDLINKLEQVAQNELRPISMLEIANQIRVSLGDTGIEYDETIIEGSNRITIQGKANTINELNNYIEALGRSGSFIRVGDPQQITRAGRTTFSVTLDYLHAADTDTIPEVNATL